MVVVEAVLPVGLGHGLVVVVVVVATVWLREYRMQKSKFDVALIYELQKKNRVEAVLLGFSHTKSPFRLPQNKHVGRDYKQYQQNHCDHVISLSKAG